MKFERRASRRTRATRNFGSRSAQWRLLILVLAIGLAVYLTANIGHPERWTWLVKLGAGQVARQGEEIDTRLQPPAESADAPPDVFRSPGAGAPEVSSEVEVEAGTELSPELLESIRDDMHFTRRENAAWFRILAILQQTPEEELVEKARPASFAQLFNQSSQYRGTLVSTQGTIRRVHRLTAPSNQQGIASYYQVWFQPDDNPSSPLVLYVLELPEQFPRGMDLHEPASAVGFYFKRWAYSAQDGIRVAPVVLGKTIHWSPRPPAPPRMDLSQLPWIVGAALALTAIFVAWLVFRTRREAVETEETPDLRPLSEIDVPHSPFPAAGSDAPPPERRDAT